jgi:hypothetical protein
LSAEVPDIAVAVPMVSKTHPRPSQPRQLTAANLLWSSRSCIRLDLTNEYGANPTTINSGASAAEFTWGYAPSSPFQARYRCRIAGGSWSRMLSPFEPLKMKADGTMSDDNHAVPDEFDIEGTYLYAASSRIGTLYYLPGAPAPERDAQGRLTLSIMRLPHSAILQLGSRYALSKEQLAHLQTRVTSQCLGLANCNLQPAQIAV